MDQPETPAAVTAPATLVCQYHVRPGSAAAFTVWRTDAAAAVQAAEGYRSGDALPPSPPLQEDWVLLDRFATIADARRWLASDAWHRLATQVAPMLVGAADIHVMVDSDVRTEPVTLVVATKVAPGREAEFRAWEASTAKAQARFPGYQGYRLSPPVPGVQDDWLTILRFDSQAHLQAWLDSPDRKEALRQAQGFAPDYHTQVVRSGFDQWFQAPGTASAAVWKQNMLVLLGLYPIVFLFGTWVGTPILGKKLGLPFWLVLFLGNIVSIVLLNWVVPWLSHRFAWWLSPVPADDRRTLATGAAIVIAFYLVMLFVFSRFPL